MVDRYNGRSFQGRAGVGASGSRSCMNNTAARNNGSQGIERSGGIDRSSGNGCPTSDCKTMLRRLQTVEFALVDIGLYLNIYPDNQEAIAYYNKLLEERCALVRSLSTKCKRPMTSFDSVGSDSWDWISSPWPWDLSAN